MGNGINKGPDGGKPILPNRAFNAPKIKADSAKEDSKIEKTNSVKSSDSKMAFTLFGLDPISSDDKSIANNLSNNDRSGPGNLPGRSQVHYDLSEIDMDDYDDNSFSL